jgi:hypothetical protein
MSDDPPFNAEAIAAALTHAATYQGYAASVTALAVSVPRLVITNQFMHLLCFYLEVPARVFGQLFRLREEIQKNIFDMLQPIIGSYIPYQLEAVSIVPSEEAPSNWREQAVAWLRGEGVTNQGRVRSDNIAARQYDGLLFRSDEEINLYRAFKSAGVSFAPLPVFVRGGNSYRRIEPDFIVVKGGMVAVIEVDGNHQESPVEAHDRTTMLVHEGAHVERVRASDCSTLEGAEVCAKRVLASLAKVRASR